MTKIDIKNEPVTEKAPFIPANLAIQAMRDSGYKNTAYALAELIDNSVQAEAKNIELICVEDIQTVRERQRKRLSEIAVLDDGIGMDATVLRQALQFGNGTRLNDRSGIGRFGMGLPNSSISQAGCVEVWSWRNGIENALYSYLDVEEIHSGKRTDVPVPIRKAIPKKWVDKADALGQSGTLVVWSKLTPDRMTWKGATATLKNTAWLVGRIHRRFIGSGHLIIRLKGGEYSNDKNSQVTINDPMYLTPAPTLPSPFNAEPMFNELDTQTITVEVNGTPHKVVTRYSVAKEKTIALAGGGNRGDMPYGQDAAHNIGVSVMREGRELMLDRSWTIQYDPRDRWWGCEVEFPAALDEAFGVTNNKQAATVFNELAGLDWTELKECKDDKLSDVINRLKEDGDSKGLLLELSENIKSTLSTIRSTIKTQARGTRAGEKRHTVGDPTEETNERWKSRDETKPIPGDDTPHSEDELKTLHQDLKEDTRNPDPPEEILYRMQRGELKVIYLDKDLGSSSQLFSVRRIGPTTEVIFNRLHPAFDIIIDTVSADENVNSLSSVELEERLLKASKAVQMLFAAWARMEVEDAPGQRKYEDVRESWGKLARDFLDH